MLQEVRTKLEAVNDEVCALRALASEPMEPSGPIPEPSPLPPPSTAPPPVDLLGIVLVNAIMRTGDQTMENGGEPDDDWRTIRRSAGIWDRRSKICVIKGFTKQKERRASVPKPVIVEDHMEGARSSLEIANMLCGMTHMWHNAR